MEVHHGIFSIKNEEYTIDIRNSFAGAHKNIPLYHGLRGKIIYGVF